MGRPLIKKYVVPTLGLLTNSSPIDTDLPLGFILYNLLKKKKIGFDHKLVCSQVVSTHYVTTNKIIHLYYF